MDKGCQSQDEKDVEGPKSAISRNWFMSLSRRKKSNSKNSDLESSTRASSECDLKLQDKKPRKDEQNVFQKIKRRMEIRFPSRQRKVISTVNEDEPKINTEQPKQTENKEENSKPLGDHYRTLVAKKWLGQEAGPNFVMYKACSEMIKHSWYWGQISRHDAQKQLRHKPNGSFLVRDSESNGSQFTLSFRIRNCTLHYRIQHRDDCWNFEDLHYESIAELIEDIMLRSTDENFVCYVKVPSEMQPPFPIILKYPVSRYLKIPALQDLCRRIIQQHVAPEQIETLPIPLTLQDYLVEKSTIFF